MPLIKNFVRLSSDVYQTFSFIFQRFVRPFSDDLSPLPDVAETLSVVAITPTGRLGYALFPYVKEEQSNAFSMWIEMKPAGKIFTRCKTEEAFAIWISWFK